jgi:hypothetical protein
MGRGRQKAKQTKAARRLKYFSPNTDYKELEKELSATESFTESFDSTYDEIDLTSADSYEIPDLNNY